MMGGKRWSSDELATLRREYGETETVELADKLGRTVYAVRSQAREKGITTGYRRYECNHRYFDAPLNRRQAYWLGVLMGDGSVRTSRPIISLAVAERDRELVDNLKEDTESEYPIYKESRDVDGWERVVVWQVYSAAMKGDLCDWGVIPQKSQGHPNPTINEELLPHYVRGLFDSDGNVSNTGKRKSIRIYGTQSQSEWLRDCTGYGTAHCANQSWVWKVNTNGGRKSIYYWVYDGVDRYLWRKRVSFEAVVR